MGDIVNLPRPRPFHTYCSKKYGGGWYEREEMQEGYNDYPASVNTSLKAINEWKGVRTIH